MAKMILRSIYYNIKVLYTFTSQKWYTCQRSPLTHAPLSILSSPKQDSTHFWIFWHWLCLLWHVCFVKCYVDNVLNHDLDLSVCLIKYKPFYYTCIYLTEYCASPWMQQKTRGELCWNDHASIGFCALPPVAFHGHPRSISWLWKPPEWIFPPMAVLFRASVKPQAHIEAMAEVQQPELWESDGIL